jgi:hypothetical protein
MCLQTLANDRVKAVARGDIDLAPLRNVSGYLAGT